MPLDPATISLISSLSGQLMPLLAGTLGHKPTPEEQFAKVMELLRTQTAGARSGAVQGAQARGGAVGQNFASLVGESGLGATGVGATAAGMADSYSSSEASRAGAEFDSNLLSQGVQLFGTPGMVQPTRWQSFLQGYSNLLGTGQDPFGAALQGILTKTVGAKPAATGEAPGAASAAMGYDTSKPFAASLSPGVAAKRKQKTADSRARYNFFNPSFAT